MTTAIKRRRGTTVQHSTFTGLEGELTVDTTKDTVVVHDGATAGGFPLLKEANPTFTGVLSSPAGTAAAPAITTTGDTNTGIFFPAADTIAFTEGGVEAMRITSAGAVLVGQTAANYNVEGISFTKDGYITACADEATANTNSVLYLNRRSSDGEMISFYRDGGQTGFIGTTSTNNMTFATGATERMRIDSAGSVGIGTASPVAKLQIVGAAGSSTVRFTGRSSDNSTTIDFYSNDNATRYGFQFANATGIQYSTAGSIPLTFGTNFTERMRITATGDVGIGTSSPGVKLDVAGGAIRSLVSGGTPRIYFANGSTQLDIANTSNDFVFNLDAAERMRITYTGNVGIGTSSPQAKFNVSAAGAEGIEIYPAFSSTNLIQSYNRSGAAYTTLRFNALTYEFQGSGTERMRIDGSGNVGIGTSSPTAKLDVAGPIKTLGYTVATLPAGVVGMRAYVTDALAPSFGVTVAGSGAVTIPVFYNGANWIVA